MANVAFKPTTINTTSKTGVMPPPVSPPIRTDLSPVARPFTPPAVEIEYIRETLGRKCDELTHRCADLEHQILRLLHEQSESKKETSFISNKNRILKNIIFAFHAAYEKGFNIHNLCDSIRKNQVELRKLSAEFKLNSETIKTHERTSPIWTIFERQVNVLLNFLVALGWSPTECDEFVVEENLA